MSRMSNTLATSSAMSATSKRERIRSVLPWLRRSMLITRWLAARTGITRCQVAWESYSQPCKRTMEDAPSGPDSRTRNSWRPARTVRPVGPAGRVCSPRNRGRGSGPSMRQRTQAPSAMVRFLRRVMAPSLGSVLACAAPERIHHEDMLGDGAAANEMLGDDALHHFDRDPAVPGSLGIHHGDRTLFTHPKAIDLGPKQPARPRHRDRPVAGIALPGRRRRRQALLLEPTLQIRPDRAALRSSRALGRRLIRAEEDVALEAADRQGVGDGGEPVCIAHRRHGTGGSHRTAIPHPVHCQVVTTEPAKIAFIGSHSVRKSNAVHAFASAVRPPACRVYMRR